MLLKVANKNVALTPEGEMELRRESRGEGVWGGMVIGGVLGSKIGNRLRRAVKGKGIGKHFPAIGLGLGAVTGGILGREHLGRALDQKKRMRLISAYAGENPRMTPEEARKIVSRYNFIGQRRAMRREGKTWDEIDRETLKVASAYGFTPEELDYIIQEGLEEVVKP